MKTLFLGLTAFLFAFNSQAQNQNVTGVTKTTVTTIKDSEGAKTQVKQQNTQETQDIKLKEGPGDPLNKEMEASPIQVTSTTQITNPDGSTRTVNVDRSAYYEGNGQRYKVALDPSGYTISSDRNSKAALLRRTSTNSYIYRTKDKTAVSYFDSNGNLVVETYDDKSDKVSIQTYNRVK